MAKFLSVLKESLFTPSPVVVGPNEIVPGVEKPTVILTNMIAAEALKDPKSVSRDAISASTTVFVFETPDMGANFELYQQSEQSSYVTRKHVLTFYRIEKGKRDSYGSFLPAQRVVEKIFLDSKLEKETLEKALHEALRLKEKLIAQEAENAKQDNAMKLIEEFFTTKPEPKPKRVAKPKAPKLVANPLKTSNKVRR